MTLSPERLTGAEYQPLNPYAASVETLAAFDVMCADIAANAYAQTYLAELRSKIARDHGETALDIPDTFGEDLAKTETMFAYNFVGSVVDFVSWASAARGHGEGPIRRLVIDTDLDGTLVPHGDESRWDLRPGFIPAVRYLQWTLGNRGIQVQVANISDRPQKILSEEAAELLRELHEDGTFLPDEAVSSKDGTIAESLDRELRPARYDSDDTNPDVIDVRRRAISLIIDLATFDDGDFHEKAAIEQLRAYGKDADPHTIRFVLDDLSYAGEIKPNPRLGGMRIYHAPLDMGGNQPLAPGDVYNYL